MLFNWIIQPVTTTTEWLKALICFFPNTFINKIMGYYGFGDYGREHVMCLTHEQLY